MADKLTSDAVAAREARMSYGQWMAMHYVAREKKEEPQEMLKPKMRRDMKREEMRTCVVCGQEFRIKKCNQLTCGAECSCELNRQRQRNRYRKNAVERIRQNERRV